MDTCADAPTSPSGRPARRRLRLGQPPARRGNLRGGRRAPCSRRDDALCRGHVFVRVLENVRGRDVYVVQGTDLPVERQLRRAALLDRRVPARERRPQVTAVVPYFSYAKGDKKDEPRVSIRARVLADAIEAAGADRVVTMDLHSAADPGLLPRPGGPPVRDADPRGRNRARGLERTRWSSPRTRATPRWRAASRAGSAAGSRSPTRRAPAMTRRSRCSACSGTSPAATRCSSTTSSRRAERWSRRPNGSSSAARAR